MNGHEFNILQFLFEAKEVVFKNLYVRMPKKGYLTKVNATGSMCHLHFMKNINFEKSPS